MKSRPSSDLSCAGPLSICDLRFAILIPLTTHHASRSALRQSHREDPRTKIPESSKNQDPNLQTPAHTPSLNNPLIQQSNNPSSPSPMLTKEQFQQRAQLVRLHEANCQIEFPSPD